MKRELILFYPGELFREGNSLSFEGPKSKKSFPIKEIDSVFCFAQISFVSRVFDFLGNEGVLVYFFNYYGQIKGVFEPFNIENSSESDLFKISQVKTFLDKNKRLEIAKEFVLSGYENMIFLLNYKNVDLGDFLRFKDLILNSKTIEELMINEAQMRNRYYKYFSILIKNNDFSFEKRSFRPPLDPINAMISFGNSLFYSFILTEMYKTVIDPKISFLHSPQERRFSLTFDISEIFKPIIVDRFILQLVNKRIISAENHFEYLKDGSCYLNNEGKKTFIKYFLNFLEETITHGILGRKVSFKYLIRLEVLKLIKSIRNNEKYSAFRYDRRY